LESKIYFGRGASWQARTKHSEVTAFPLPRVNGIFAPRGNEKKRSNEVKNRISW